MRTLKFRAWITEPNFPYPMQENPLHRCDAGDVLDGKSIYKDWILMQFTGLFDKNGKEIYEGDIVYKFGVDDAPYEIKYGVQSIGHDWLGVGFYAEDKCEICNVFGGEYIEIIGNIYQNPELIN